MADSPSQTVSVPDDPLAPIPRPELVIGIVGPLGANPQGLHKALEKALKRVGYRVHEVRVSRLLHDLRGYGTLSASGPEDDRIKKHMQAGTAVRQTVGRGDIMALMTVANIREIRQKNTGDPMNASHQTAYIVNSLKHPDEVKALRKIYGRLFVLVSAYLPREKRVDELSRVIARSRAKAAEAQKFRNKAEDLICIDEDEEGEDLGQGVTEAFPEADVFVSTENKNDLEKEISRFIEILFSCQFHTPTKDEMGMYIARSAALRSADLSRQVGAAICNLYGDVISIGCNEVPRAGGGQYWPDGQQEEGYQPNGDQRDFQWGYDSSARSKEEIIKEVVHRLNEVEGVKVFNDGLGDVSRITDILLHGIGKDILKGTQLFNILEFGRPIHAEMAALMTASRLGISVQDNILYSTTFPCHMCARHIMAAGIKRVVYIEPYPKRPSRNSVKGVGWPGRGMIPNGCQSQFGGQPHVDPDHPAAA